jgi:tryptophanyl-tRNA synthetase
MGKSEEQSGVLNLSDSPDEVATKFKVAVTDPARKRRADPGNPEKCNIYTFHHLLSSVDEIEWARKGCETAGIGCMECKMVAAGHVNEVLVPIQQRRRELDLLGLDFVLDVLSDGGKRARARFAETVECVKDKMGVPAY